MSMCSRCEAEFISYFLRLNRRYGGCCPFRVFGQMCEWLRSLRVRALLSCANWLIATPMALRSLARSHFFSRPTMGGRCMTLASFKRKTKIQNTLNTRGCMVLVRLSTERDAHASIQHARHMNFQKNNPIYKSECARPCVIYCVMVSK